MKEKKGRKVWLNKREFLIRVTLEKYYKCTLKSIKKIYILTREVNFEKTYLLKRK